MSQQIPIPPETRAPEADSGDGTHEIAPDLAYCRLVMANVVFYGRRHAEDGDWVLIDAGVPGTASLIKTAAGERFGRLRPPSAIILTHGHFDHVGALETLVEEWGVPVFAHPLELPYLNGRAAYPPGDPSVGGGLVASLAGLYPTRPVNVAARLQPLPANGTVPGMPGWQWLHTPGHSPGHVSLWRPSDRAMIVGDAFVTTAPESAYATALQTPEIHGPPRYFTIDWPAAEASVLQLAALEPDLVVTGHGRAMQGPTMTAALHRLAADFTHVAIPERGRYVERPARVEDGSAYLKP